MFRGFTFLLLALAFGSITILDCSNLQAMENDLAESYFLGADIDCTGVSFVPVGNDATPFTGSFNGFGYRILNLNVEADNSGLAGLFGSVSGSRLRYVTFENPSVVIAQPSGAVFHDYGVLAGKVTSGTIFGVVVNNPVVTSNNPNAWVGGVCGYITDGSTVSSTHVIGGTLTGQSRIGGISGHASHCTFSDSSSTFLASGGEAGGFLGSTNDNQFSRTPTLDVVPVALVTGSVESFDDAGNVCPGASCTAFDPNQSYPTASSGEQVVVEKMQNARVKVVLPAAALSTLSLTLSTTPYIMEDEACDKPTLQHWDAFCPVFVGLKDFSGPVSGTIDANNCYEVEYDVYPSTPAASGTFELFYHDGSQWLSATSMCSDPFQVSESAVIFKVGVIGTDFVAAMATGGGFGDPHFIGLHGQKFLFDGEEQKIYTVLSTQSLQVNMFLAKDNIDLVVIQEIGILVGKDAVFIDSAARLRVNGHRVESAVLLADNVTTVIRDLKRDGSGIVVQTPEFFIRLIPRGYEIDFKEIKMLRVGGEDVHGIVGQTWKVEKWPGSSFEVEIQDQSKLFGGLLDGSISDYEVHDGLFGKVSTFGTFDAHAYPLVHQVPNESNSQ